MSVVIITGSCGLVGSEACTFLAKRGFKVVGIDNNLRKRFFGKEGSTNWVKKKLKIQINKYEHYNIDIRNLGSLEKIFIKYKKNIKLIIHSAAQPSHDFAKNNAKIDFEVNALGTLNLLRLTEKYCRYAPFIHMSTNKVYGDNPNKLKLKEKKSRWDIDDKLYKNGINENFSIDNCTHSFFGVSKIYSDFIAQEYGKNNKLNTGIFRAGCITGPNHSGAKLHGFLSFLVKSIVHKKKYFIFGYKGKQVRDNIHSLDVVKAFDEFIKKPKSGGRVYNIGGGRQNSCSIIEAIKLIEKISKTKSKYKILKQNRIGDHLWWITDNSKFKKDYPNWKIEVSLIKSLKQMVSFEKNR